MLSLVETGPLVLQKVMFQFRQCIRQCLFTFLNYIPLEKGGALELNKLFTQIWFVPNLVEIGPVVLEKKFFLNFVNVFRYLPLKIGGALHLNKFEYFSPKYDLCQVWFKLAEWFRRRFLNFVNSGALHLNELESPLPKVDLCQVWLIMAQWFWRRRFKKLSMYLRNSVIISLG